MPLSDYAGRTIDIVAFRGPAAIGEVALSQTLFGADGSEVCTGIQKLVQRWLVHFLTEAGSMPFLPDQGTTFLQAARQGRFVTPADVRAEFSFAASRVKAAMLAEELATDPDDERLADASLDDVILDDDRLDILVTITSLAGSSRKVILPVSVVPFSTEL